MVKNAMKSKSYLSNREQRRLSRHAKQRGDSNIYDMDMVFGRQRPFRNGGVNTQPIQYLTSKQQTYHQMIQSHTITIGLGTAGTGKTHIAADHAALQLIEGKISNIIISRPAIESGRGLGFLPGEIEDKWAPYFKPVRKILEKRLGVSHVENLLKNGTIEIAPLEFLRGDTFENAFVLLDEAQNTTEKEMLTFLTRIGKHCTVVIDGDIDQIDIKEPSGLVDALQRLRGMCNYTVCEFEEDDIVRNDIVKDIIKRYRRKI